jgi:predicted ABC-type ATPase
MTTLAQAVDHVLAAQKKSKKPLAIVLAGHNGSGKSTMWYDHLADVFQIPLINADRMMMSILPEVGKDEVLPTWASELRDKNQGWMRVAQDGVQAFVVQALANKVPFATETVFSHWKDIGKGRFESKIDRIVEMQKAGYFVILFFVGLTDDQLSIGRVSTRVAKGGHGVPVQKLIERFPRTQKAVGAATLVADATILVDNSRDESMAFSVCRIQMRKQEVYDVRAEIKVPAAIQQWLNIVSPR